MIEINSVKYHYGDAIALDEIDLKIPDEEFLLIVGPNGSGKTTLIRHFNGLLEPDRGQVLINGELVGDDLVSARRSIGMVFQNPRDQFVAATIGSDVAFGPENLGLSHEEIDRRVEEALASVRMGGRKKERIDQLSGGEQARVAIAGALAMKPDHIVLDEPLASLDKPARRSILDHLASLNDNGAGIVVVTHDICDLDKLADRIVVLQNGCIVRQGRPQDVEDELGSFDVRPC